MKVRGSLFPPEWDITSSAVTVYHRTNVVQITDDDGRIEYEYDEEQMTFEKFENISESIKLEQRTTTLEATQSDVIDVLASALGVTI